MSRSKTLYRVQQFDTQIDNAEKRIIEINARLSDTRLLDQALQIQAETGQVLAEKKRIHTSTETAVGDHSLKIDQNQKKLYSGMVTNPKDLEDLQLESTSLTKYLLVLEERQLEAMLEMEEAQDRFNDAEMRVISIQEESEIEHKNLIEEKNILEKSISTLAGQKEAYLSSTDIPDLSTYNSLRKSSGGLAVTLMISESCSSCGANIPSAIAQEARSPLKLAFCPTCNRILHPA